MIDENFYASKEHHFRKAYKAGAISTEMLIPFGTTLKNLYCCVQVAHGDGSHEARQRRR